MLDSIYIGLTGLNGFSDGLRNISNNVANVNTPGFKGVQLQFEDLFYRLQSGTGNGSDQANLFMGSGMKTGASTILFKQGDVKSTGNDLDAAVDGNGFFVLHRDDGKLVFTRNGQFSVDANGVLVVRGGTDRVQGLVANRLADINIRDFVVNPARVTTTIKLTGNLSVDDSDNTQTVANISVFDAHGGNNPLKVTLTKDTSSGAAPRSWKIRIEDAAGNLVDDTGEIRFNGDGSPQAGFETHPFTFTPVAGDAMNLTLDFGTAGGFSGATNFSAGPDSSLALGSQDGFAAGALTKTRFDADGKLVLTYSNGQTASQGQLALAWFDFLQGLEPSGQSAFENNTGLAMRLGAPRTSLFGSISAGSIESSNVDLSQEFTDLIVIQRGFQGSSQVVTVANEMIQQLLDIQGGGSRG
jgi:flagellar hook protein FlgE